VGHKLKTPKARIEALQKGTFSSGEIRDVSEPEHTFLTRAAAAHICAFFRAAMSDKLQFVVAPIAKPFVTRKYRHLSPRQTEVCRTFAKMSGDDAAAQGFADRFVF
jgi:hypothetical protein